MLYLHPPYPIINGVAIFPDHQDPLQFYYMPMAPHLSQIDDPSTGGKSPQIQVIKYRGGVGTGKEINGGFLNFDCNIGIDDDRLKQVISKLRSMLDLSGDPRIAPLPVVDGSVKIMLFGAETPPPPSGTSHPAGSGTGAATAPASSPTGDPTGPKFVTKIQQGAKPSLYGDNQAAFSVALDQYGVTVLEKALQGAMSPIGIVYSLDYLALRPAYTVKLHIDWDRVQKHMDEKFSVNTLFASADIDTVVDQLIEDRTIQLDVDTFVAEGESDSDVLSRRDQAVNEVRDMITNAFFTSSIDPKTAERDGWDKAADFAQRLSDMPFKTRGGGLFSYSKMDYTRIDKKKLDVTMNERTTVRRTIFPQGHLFNMFAGLDMSRYILDVDVDDPFFQRRRLRVISRANFDPDQIDSVAVNLDYNGAKKNVLLTPDHTTEDLEWASNVVNGAVQKDLKYDYAVNFKEGHPAFRTALTATSETSAADSIEVRPSDLFSIITIPIAALTFPWDRYARVEVSTRYLDPDHNIRMEQTFNLTKDKSSDTWRIFARDPAKTQFDYKVIYRAVDNRDIEKDWVSTDSQQVTLRDPYPMKRVLDVVVAVDWQTVQQVFADVFYEDAANNISLQTSLSFVKGEPITKSASFDLRDAKARLVSYEITIVKSNGTVTQVPRSYTLEPRIFVTANLKGHKIVTIKTQALDFNDAKIKEVDVQLKYQDEQAGLSFANVAVLKSQDDRATFEFDYVDPAKGSYQYQVAITQKNGLTRNTDWASSDSAALTIPLN